MNNEEEKITISVNEEDVQNLINCYEKDIKYIKLLEQERDKYKSIVGDAIKYIEEHIKYECDDAFNGMQFYSHHLYDFSKEDLLNILKELEEGVNK